MPPRARRRAGAPRLVTLSSDVGAAYAAQMKAVLLGELPAAAVVDLAHDLRPHDIAEAAFVVRAMAERFPAGTVHLVVVDPGVGGRRQPVVIRCRDGSVLVGPDNGVLVPLAEALGGGWAYRIEAARLRLPPRVGTTFDGRDLFAPVAARLAQGLDPRRVGPRTGLRTAPGTIPRRTPRGAVGTVAHIDRFGNLITDLPSAWIPSGTATIDLRIGRCRRRVPVATSYEQRGSGRLVALGSSFGTAELAVGHGRACDELGAAVGTPVRFDWAGKGSRRARRKRKYRTP